MVAEAVKRWRGHNLGLTDDRSRSDRGHGQRPCGSGCGRGCPSSKVVQGYHPRENVDTYNARIGLCILECRIGLVYDDDNMAVVGFVA